MTLIVPAVIPVSQEDLEEKLGKLAAIPEITEVQIDVVDGRYASPASWPYQGDRAAPSRLQAEGRMLPQAGRFRLEMDLMTVDPESAAGSWIALGATRVVIHAESTPRLGRLLEEFAVAYGHQKGFASDLLSVGLAIGPATDLALIAPFMDRVDFVQFMGIKTIGRQGEPFDPAVVRKIADFKERHPGTPVQVDGGVSLSTAPLLLAAGVSRLVVGSALWKAGDLRAAYAEFQALTERHGIYE